MSDITLMEALQVVTEEMKEYVDKNATDVDGAVVYNQSQQLTDPEKAQARENIGAPSISDIPTSTSSLNNDSNFLAGTDATLSTSGKAADAKAVGDKFIALPISVAEDSYTDVVGLRKPLTIALVKSENTITSTIYLQGNRTSVSVVTIGDDGRPATIVTNGVECAISWEGFDA